MPRLLLLLLLLAAVAVLHAHAACTPGAPDDSGTDPACALCGPGTSVVSDTTCAACPSNTFQPLVGQSSCTSCSLVLDCATFTSLTTCNQHPSCAWISWTNSCRAQQSHARMDLPPTNFVADPPVAQVTGTFAYHIQQPGYFTSIGLYLDDAMPTDGSISLSISVQVTNAGGTQQLYVDWYDGAWSRPVGRLVRFRDTDATQVVVPASVTPGWLQPGWLMVVQVTASVADYDRPTLSHWILSAYNPQDVLLQSSDLLYSVSDSIYGVTDNDTPSGDRPEAYGWLVADVMTAPDALSTVSKVACRDRPQGACEPGAPDSSGRDPTCVTCDAGTMRLNHTACGVCPTGTTQAGVDQATCTSCIRPLDCADFTTLATCNQHLSCGWVSYTGSCRSQRSHSRLDLAPTNFVAHPPVTDFRGDNLYHLTRASYITGVPVYLDADMPTDGSIYLQVSVSVNPPQGDQQLGLVWYFEPWTGPVGRMVYFRVDDTTTVTDADAPLGPPGLMQPGWIVGVEVKSQALDPYADNAPTWALGAFNSADVLTTRPDDDLVYAPADSAYYVNDPNSLSNVVDSALGWWTAGVFTSPADAPTVSRVECVDTPNSTGRSLLMAQVPVLQGGITLTYARGRLNVSLATQNALNTTLAFGACLTTVSTSTLSASYAVTDLVPECAFHLVDCSNNATGACEGHNGTLVYTAPLSVTATDPVDRFTLFQDTVMVPIQVDSTSTTQVQVLSGPPTQGVVMPPIIIGTSVGARAAFTNLDPTTPVPIGSLIAVHVNLTDVFAVRTEMVQSPVATYCSHDLQSCVLDAVPYWSKQAQGLPTAQQLQDGGGILSFPPNEAGQSMEEWVHLQALPSACLVTPSLCAPGVLFLSVRFHANETAAAQGRRLLEANATTTTSISTLIVQFDLVVVAANNDNNSSSSNTSGLLMWLGIVVGCVAVAALVVWGCMRRSVAYTQVPTRARKH